MTKSKSTSAILNSLSENSPLPVSVSQNKENKREIKVVENDPNPKEEPQKEKVISNFIFEKAQVPFFEFNKANKKPIYVSEDVHKKLSSLAKLIDSNIMDIGNSIILDFMEQNKNNIKTAIKKNTSNTWD